MWVAIIGPVNSGKSNIADKISQKLNYFQPKDMTVTTSQEFEENPEVFALCHQLNYLGSAFQRDKDIRNLGKDTVSKGLAYETMLYSKLLHEFGFLSDEEMESFELIFDCLSNQRPPDVIIYLSLDLVQSKNLMALKQHDVGFFSKEDRLKVLNELYDEFSNRIRVPLVKCDLSNNFDEMWSEIEFGLASVTSTGGGGDSVWSKSLVH